MMLHAHVQADARRGSPEDLAVLTEKRKALEQEVTKLQVFLAPHNVKI